MRTGCTPRMKRKPPYIYLCLDYDIYIYIYLFISRNITWICQWMCVCIYIYKWLVGQNPPFIWFVAIFMAFCGMVEIYRLAHIIHFATSDQEEDSSSFADVLAVVAIAKHVDFPIMFMNFPGCLSPYTILTQGGTLQVPPCHELKITTNYRYTHKTSWNWTYVCQLAIPTWDLHMFELEEQWCRWTLLGQSLRSPGAIAFTNRAPPFFRWFHVCVFTDTINHYWPLLININ